MKRIGLIPAAVVWLLCMSGCYNPFNGQAWTGQTISPRGQFIVARETLNSTGNALANLIEAKKIAGEKAQLVKLLVHQASQALDTWEAAILTGSSTVAAKLEADKALAAIVVQRTVAEAGDTK